MEITKVTDCWAVSVHSMYSGEFAAALAYMAVSDRRKDLQNL